MMVERTYDPKGYTCSITVDVTEKQAFALDLLAKESEFSACFWAEYVDSMNRGNKTINGNQVVRMNGSHYVIGDETPSTFRGFGGAKFTIELIETEEVIESTNVWHQGDIPHQLKDILVDNAKQIVHGRGWK